MTATFLGLPTWLAGGLCWPDSPPFSSCPCLYNLGEGPHDFLGSVGFVSHLHKLLLLPVGQCFKLRQWLPNKKTHGAQGYRWGTSGKEDESRGVSRGHVPVSFQKNMRDFYLDLLLLRQPERI